VAAATGRDVWHWRQHEAMAQIASQPSAAIRLSALGGNPPLSRLTNNNLLGSNS